MVNKASTRRAFNSYTLSMILKQKKFKLASRAETKNLLHIQGSDVNC